MLSSICIVISLQFSLLTWVDSNEARCVNTLVKLVIAIGLKLKENINNLKSLLTSVYLSLKSSS